MTAPVSVPIDQRFAQLIQQFGLTKNSFAISLGKTASVVQHLIDGRNKPGYDLLCKVFEIYPNVSRDWLLLGRGPMLVSGEPTPRPLAPSASAPVAAASEPPLEPIDLSDVELPPHRRPGPGVAGTRLQPAEIAATLALAAAAAQLPVRSSAPADAATEPPAPAAAPEVPSATATPLSSTIPTTTAAPEPAPALVPVPAAPAPAALPATTTSLGPDSYVAAALNAQYLQHQLALAELRNQTPARAAANAARNAGPGPTRITDLVGFN